MATEKKESAKGLLDDFSLDDGEDFFNIKEEQEEKEDLVKEVKKLREEKEDKEDEEEEDEKKKVVDTKKKKATDDEDNDEDDVKFFEEAKKKLLKTKEDKEEDKKDKEDEEEDEDKKGSEDDDEDDIFTNLASDLKEKGIFNNIDIPKDTKVTEEQFFKMHDDEIESRVAETFESIFEEVGKKGSDFLKYISNGGNPNTFLSQLSTRFNLDELDTDNTVQVDRTLKYYLTNYEKLEDEDITDRIKWLEDGGKKKSYAEKYFKVIKEGEKEQEEDLLAQQEKIYKQKQQDVVNFNNSLKEVAQKVSTVGSFNINKSEIKGLVDSITKPIVKVGKNKYIPEFQNSLAKVLRGATDKDKEKLLTIAKILKEDFVLPDLETKLETKIVSKAKSRIASRGSKIRNTSSSGMGKSLADYMS